MHAARCQRTGQHPHLQGDSALNAWLHAINRPRERAARLYVSLCRSLHNQLHIRVQLVGNGNVRCFGLVILVADLIGDLVAHLHRAEYLCTLVGVNLLLCRPGIDVVYVEFKEILASAIEIPQHLGYSGKAVRNMKLAIVSRIALDILRIYARSFVHPGQPVRIRDRFRYRVGIFCNVVHTSLYFKVIERTHAVFSNNDFMVAEPFIFIRFPIFNRISSFLYGIILNAIRISRAIPENHKAIGDLRIRIRMDAIPRIAFDHLYNLNAQCLISLQSTESKIHTTIANELVFFGIT